LRIWGHTHAYAADLHPVGNSYGAADPYRNANAHANINASADSHPNTGTDAGTGNRDVHQPWLCGKGHFR
jgi:hypothetical protein